jgi:hypothetical protein
MTTSFSDELSQVIYDILYRLKNDNFRPLHHKVATNYVLDAVIEALPKKMYSQASLYNQRYETDVQQGFNMGINEITELLKEAKL